MHVSSFDISFVHISAEHWHNKRWVSFSDGVFEHTGWAGLAIYPMGTRAGHWIGQVCCIGRTMGSNSTARAHFKN